MKEKAVVERTVAEIVREDYRTADVFRKFGINFCCGGKISLREACVAKNLEEEKVIAALDRATRSIQTSNTLQFDNWKIDFLIDYILHVHHAYLQQQLPLLEMSMLTFVNSHRKQYPHLQEVYDTFAELSALLQAHNRHEEEIIFPYIKQIETTFRRRETYGSLFVRTLRKPLDTIAGEHARISEKMQRLVALTENFTFPLDACTNHRVIFNKLRELHYDLVQHKYLENEILFPKAVEMERQLLQC